MIVSFSFWLIISYFQNSLMTLILPGFKYKVLSLKFLLLKRIFTNLHLVWNLDTCMFSHNKKLIDDTKNAGNKIENR